MKLLKSKVAEALTKLNPEIQFERAGDWVHWKEKPLKETVLECCKAVGISIDGWRHNRETN